MKILKILASRISSDLETSVKIISTSFSYDDEKTACKKILEEAFEGKK